MLNNPIKELSLHLSLPKVHEALSKQYFEYESLYEQKTIEYSHSNKSDYRKDKVVITPTRFLDPLGLAIVRHAYETDSGLEIRLLVQLLTYDKAPISLIAHYSSEESSNTNMTHFVDYIFDELLKINNSLSANVDFDYTSYFRHQLHQYAAKMTEFIGNKQVVFTTRMNGGNVTPLNL